MTYPVRFLLPDRGYDSVRIDSESFPEGMDLFLTYNEKAKLFSKTLHLPPGNYTYHFNADENKIPCPFRSCHNDTARIVLGQDEILFRSEHMFLQNNSIVVIISIETIFWQEILLNLQSPFGSLKNVVGIPLFYEGTRCYYGFFFPIPQEDIVMAYFELKGFDKVGFYGSQGFTQKEWAVTPFELNKKKLPEYAIPNMKAIYRFDSPKDIREFDKRLDYFEHFTPSHIDAPLPNDANLRKKMEYPCTEYLQNFDLSYLLRDVFTEHDDINPSLSLLGRFYLEHLQETPFIRFKLSDDNISFWDLSRRNLTAMLRASAFQLLCSYVPDILFGEEIGLSKMGEARHMYWTKAKWNKEILNFYETLLKLREEHSIFRTGHIRFIIQDCGIWAIERFAEGKDSVFVFANHSKENIVVDLTKIIGHGVAIKELLTNHILKRKRICTIFAESVSIYKVISSPQLVEEESLS